MAITILNGDVLDHLRVLPDCSIHCVVTSPPYWGLRDYGVDGQIGLEKTPEEYVAKMVEVFREVRRVLRDDGTLWLNLGDSYSGSMSTKEAAVNPNSLSYNMGQTKAGVSKARGVVEGLKPKDLVGIPWRVAFALQQDGWYLRSDIIWSKPNPMPESVTDRPTKAHEYVFLLTKNARYYYDADAVRESAAYDGRKDTQFKGSLKDYAPIMPHGKKPQSFCEDGHERWPNKLEDGSCGRNRRTVWEIATQPTPEAHFATFPEALVEPRIKAGTSERGCCSVCGAGWERVVKRELQNTNKNRPDNGMPGRTGNGLTKERAGDPLITTLGWQPTCSCNADTVPCTVLDPFGGSGTVGLVARNLKRDAILIELNPSYVKIMKKKLRLNEQLVIP